MTETKCIDQGICPSCNNKFDAETAVNYEIGTHNIECPNCGVRIKVYTSVEYQCSID
jgi:ParB family chromosome partitioning protein